MKRLYTLLLLSGLTLFSAKGQNGIKFNPSIVNNFSKVETSVQVPASPIKSQILFVGNSHEVTVVDSKGVSAGTAKSKGGNDFVGITPEGQDFWITVNHETTSLNEQIGGGGGMSTFKVVRDADSLKVVETTLPDGRKGKFHNVDFANTVGTTVNNCGGIIAPNGDIWTAEEYPASYSPNKNYFKVTGDTMDVVIGSGRIVPFVNKVSALPEFKGKQIKAFENNGWMVQIDPKTGKAMRKQYNWGRMSFEAGAITADNKTVYLAEDGTPGLFTKFVADVAGDFSKGKLYVFNQLATGTNGKWILMDNSNLTEMINLGENAYKKGATAFIRLEWIIELGGKIYICETGLDNPSGLASAITKGGNVAQHHFDRAAAKGQVITASSVTYKDFYGRILVYDPATDIMKVHLDGGPDFANSKSDSTAVKGGTYPAKHLSNPDGLGKITVNGKNYLIINEDLNGNTYNRLPNDYKSTNACEMYLLDASIANPKIDDLIRIAVGPSGAELTGGNGTQDGKSILVNIQHPSSTVAPFTSGNGVTIALTGWDKLTNIADAAIANDFTKNATFQTPPKNLIKTQILFVGNSHEVTVVDSKGASAGTAKSKGGNDFVGITPDGQDFWITVNHETTTLNAQIGGGGGMSTFKVVRDADSLKVVETTLPDGRKGKFHNVDFANTVGTTVNNCGGIIAPNGDIWTAEEYPASYSPNKNYFKVTGDTMDIVIDSGRIMPFMNKVSALPDYKGKQIKAYENNGWMVQIDPKTGKAMRKQYNWGRMSFEAGAITADNKTVYLAEDGTPGLFTKFVADVAGDFSKGKLYVFNQLATGTNGKWILMDNSNLTEMINLGENAYKKGATAFIRLEWIIELGGKIYICETGLDNPSGLASAITKGGNVAQHHLDRATAKGQVITASSVTYKDYYGRILVYDPATDIMKVHLDGGPDFVNSKSDSTAVKGGTYPSKHLSNPDGLGKITVNGKNYLIINEDLNGNTYNRLPNDYKSTNACEMYLLDASIANPKIDDLMRIMVGPKGAELTGGNGTPDGKSILINIQHPSSTVAPFTSGNGITMALTGWDQLRTSVFPDLKTKDNQFITSIDMVTRIIYFDDIYDVRVYNIAGQLLKTRNESNRISISEFNPGIYIIQNNKGQGQKILVQ